MDKVENQNNKILFKKLVKIAIDNWKYIDYGYLCRKLIYALARTQLMFHYEDPDFADDFTDDEIKKIEELIEVEYNSEKQYKEYKRIVRLGGGV